MKRAELVGRWSGHAQIHRRRDAILPKDEAFGKFRIARLPSLGSGTIRVGYYPVTYILLGELSDNPEATYRIAEYATSSIEGTVLFANKHFLPPAYIPGLKSLATESSPFALLGGQQMMGLLARFIFEGESGTLNLTPYFAEAQDIFVEKVSALLAGEISPEQFAKGVAEKLRKSVGLK